MDKASKRKMRLSTNKNCGKIFKETKRGKIILRLKTRGQLQKELAFNPDLTDSYNVRT